MRNISSMENYIKRISVKNFGPVGEAMVELRPLTIFLGSTNTGKSYFTKLIYVLHQVMDGFPRFPYRPSDGLHAGRFRTPSLEESTAFMDGVKAVIEKLRAGREDLMLSDMPKIVREALRDGFREGRDGALADVLSDAFKAYFGVGSSAQLVRESGRDAGNTNAHVSLEIGGQHKKLWSWSAEIGESVEVALDEENDGSIVLLPKEGALSKRTLNKLVHLYERLVSGSKEHGMDGEQLEEFLKVFDLMLRELLGYPAEHAVPAAYYLSGARGGIALTHHVITGSIVSYHTQGRQSEEVPRAKLPGNIGDLMQQIILRGGKGHGPQVLDEIAHSLETDILGGLVSIDPGLGNYPRIMFQPLGMKDKIDLSRASSTAIELAPFILYLRHVLKIGDILIFEEPETHLHPAAQTQLAAVLARLANAGVRVIITTHSDWLLQEFGNLIRLGELERYGAVKPVDEGKLPSTLQPNDVGAWSFRSSDGESRASIKEIPYDRVEGIGEYEYDNVSEDQYIRSAQLQNRLIEREAEGGDGVTVKEIPFDFIGGVEPPEFGKAAAALYDESVWLMDKHEEATRDANKEEQ